MTEEVLAKDLLNQLHQEVENAKDDEIYLWRKELGSQKTAESNGSVDVPETILDACETIVNNRQHNKYIFSIVLTSCIKKALDPKQDIRVAQENMKNGYSNRSFDQRVITPFLKRFDYTHCEASGLESGRNLERPIPWDLNYPCNPRGRGNKESFLGVLDYLQKGGEPKTVAKYLLLFDKQKRQTSSAAVVPPQEYKISKIMSIFTRHFSESSGQGKSRLPVLALYAIYEELIGQLSRYEGCELLPLEKHTTADLRSGSIGDIQVNKNNKPFEGVEVKSEKPITVAMVNELKRKFDGKSVSRYYILSTHPTQILEEDRVEIEKAVEDAENLTGCQIISNGLIRTLWYYLRLLDDPSVVLTNYQELLESDSDIRQSLRDTWNAILSQEYEISSN